MTLSTTRAAPLIHAGIALSKCVIPLRAKLKYRVFFSKTFWESFPICFYFFSKTFCESFPISTFWESFPIFWLIDRSTWCWKQRRNDVNAEKTHKMVRKWSKTFRKRIKTAFWKTFLTFFQFFSITFSSFFDWSINHDAEDNFATTTTLKRRKMVRKRSQTIPKRFKTAWKSLKHVPIASDCFESFGLIWNLIL